VRVVTDLAAQAPVSSGSVVTIGAYDGVHLGHQAVLRLVHELAAARGLESVCLTFDRHPAEVVRPESAPCVLTSLDQKLELLAGTGYVDTAVVLAFDEARSHETAEDFVREILVEGVAARRVVVGADFHFGYRRHGNVRLLEQMGAELGFEVVGLGLIPIEGDPSATPYSSTAIRGALADGRVDDAARLLGRPYALRGVVQPGEGRGRELGFPTANVALPERCCRPAEGIYAGWFVGADGIERVGAVSLGRRPTFHQAAAPLLEVHVLDFDGDLYDQDVVVRFVARLRGEERFESADALVEQMQRDVDATRRAVG
jgi:riboflavin kinase / FMN adenylyltransferase